MNRLRKIEWYEARRDEMKALLLTCDPDSSSEELVLAEIERYNAVIRRETNAWIDELNIGSVS